MILYLSRNLLISNKKKVGKLVRDNLLQEKHREQQDPKRINRLTFNQLITFNHN